MKAISLWQPWASLVAVGAKRYETRHWPAPDGLVGQRVAIHAAKRTSELHRREEPRFMRALPSGELPLGALVATARLHVVVSITPQDVAAVFAQPSDEFWFGDWTPGRYAWALRDVHRIDPIPYRGSQGWFDVPDELIASPAPAPASLVDARG